MNAPASPVTELAAELRQHLTLCREILALVEREGQDLRTADQPAFGEFARAKKGLLPRLETSLDQVRRHRARWAQRSPADRAREPEVPGLLRQAQELIMKIIVLDRENEQSLLRRGLVPTRHLPSVHRQRPHYVADLYRRQATR